MNSKNYVLQMIFETFYGWMKALTRNFKIWLTRYLKKKYLNVRRHLSESTSTYNITYSYSEICRGINKILRYNMPLYYISLICSWWGCLKGYVQINSTFNICISILLSFFRKMSSSSSLLRKKKRKL